METAFNTQLPCISWDISLALEFRAISSLILRGLEFDIPVYSKYTGPKHQGFE